MGRFISDKNAGVGLTVMGIANLSAAISLGVFGVQSFAEGNILEGIAFSVSALVFTFFTALAGNIAVDSQNKQL